MSKNLCGSCNKEANDRYVVIKEVRYHAECFKCKECDKSLGGQPYIQHENSFLCQDCYYKLQGKTCGHCEEIIKGQYIEAMGTYWCPDHFVCATCSQPFPDDVFYKHDNHPYCQTHYRELTSENCAVCKEAILEGEMMEGGSLKYHMKCFVCDEDKKQIKDGDRYHEFQGKLYCDEHLKKKLSLVCAICGKPIIGEYCIVQDQNMHKECYQEKRSSTKSSGTSSKQPSSGTSSKQPSSGTSSKQPSSGTSSKGSPSNSYKKKTTKTTTTTTNSVTTKPVVQESKEDDDEKVLTFYAYESLIASNSCPPGVKLTEREKHLSPVDFEKLFGCNKATFYKLPRWKQQAKKKKLNLF